MDSWYIEMVRDKGGSVMRNALLVFLLVFWAFLFAISGHAQVVMTETLSSEATAITISHIPASYSNLRATFAGRTAGTSASVLGVRFNSDTGANYDAVVGAASFLGLNYGRLNDNGTTSNSNTKAADCVSVLVPNYAATRFFKNALSQKGDLGNIPSVQLGGILWHSTSAVSSITFYSAAGEKFVPGTTATVVVE